MKFESILDLINAAKSLLKTNWQHELLTMIDAMYPSNYLKEIIEDIEDGDWSDKEKWDAAMSIIECAWKRADIPIPWALAEIFVKARLAAMVERLKQKGLLPSLRSMPGKKQT